MPASVRNNPQAKAEWKRLAPMLLKAGVLSEVDGPALAAVCLDSVLLEDLRARLMNAEPILAPEDKQFSRANPLLNAIGKVQDRLSRGLQQFGLTPASRTRIQTGESTAGPQKSLEELLRRKTRPDGSPVLLPWSEFDPPKKPTA